MKKNHLQRNRQRRKAAFLAGGVLLLLTLCLLVGTQLRAAFVPVGGALPARNTGIGKPITPGEELNGEPGEKTDLCLSVPCFSQEGTLPNGCEAVSAAMLLQFYGFSITPADVVDQFLDCRDLYWEDGVLYGPDPRDAYAGDPRSKKGGYGCFAPVLATALRRAAGDGYTVTDATGTELDELLDTVKKGLPVAVWVTQTMQPVSGYYSWKNDLTGEEVNYPKGEHCLVLAGCDETYYYCYDPLDSRGLMGYPRQDFLDCYISLGKQAVYLERK